MSRSRLFYFGQKNPIKLPILTLSSALVKTCQISHVIFQTTSRFFFNSSVPWKITPLYFYSSRSQLKHNFLDFRVLGSKLVKFLVSILKRKFSSSSIFVLLFIFMAYNSSVKFKVTPFLLWTKGSTLKKITLLYFCSSNNIYFAKKDPITVRIFKTFECSGQNLSNSLCQFWNSKSIPLRILYPSWVSLKITPLFFFSSNTRCYAQKEHIKKNIIEAFECSGQNLLNSSCQFWNDKSIPLQILHHFHDT